MSKTYRDKHRGCVKFFERNMPKEAFQWKNINNPEYAKIRQEWNDLWSFHNKNTWKYYAHARRRWIEKNHAENEKIRRTNVILDKELYNFIQYEWFGFFVEYD